MEDLDYKNIYNKTYTKDCAYCNTTFDMYPTSAYNWCYRNEMNHRKNWFCSYTCQCRYEKEHAPKIKIYEYQKWI